MQIDRQLYAHVGFRRFPVMSFAQVSAAYRALLEELDLGSSQAPRCLIEDEAGKVYAHCSYNGKVWAGEHYRDGAQPLYVPSY